MELHINVANKIATYRQRDGDIICGNSDYIIRFSFDSEWDDIAEKTARFIYNGVHQDVPIAGDACTVPVLRDVDQVEIGVYGGDLHTTTPAVISCQKSILCLDSRINPDDGKIYENICEEAASRAEEAASRAEEASVASCGWTENAKALLLTILRATAPVEQSENIKSLEEALLGTITESNVLGKAKLGDIILGGVA